jgi:predicted lysophospholipase L1 biosynthesis ABC-type transport system permease subunit
MSVYVKDIELIDETVKELEDLGYHTLKEKDTLAQTGFVEMVKITKVIITIGLIVVLFFISYFIIKLILKSRNIYYAILRMLGASRTACRDLLMIELLTICNLSYFIFVGLVQINRVKEIIKWDLLTMVETYFKTGDYIKLYIILVCMSILIAIRYARKLFKTSAMATYREEV